MKFKTPEELQAKVDAYFAATPIEKQSITGLALALETTRDVLCDYQEKEGYSYIVKIAKLRVEHACEVMGMEKGRSFDIFRLKQMGWRDKQEVENTVVADVTTRQADLPDHIKELIGAVGKG